VFGPTSPEKFVPPHSAATVVRSQEFGSNDMAAIPLEAVEAALEEVLSRPLEAPDGVAGRPAPATG
jgi:hypothetical protein